MTRPDAVPDECEGLDFAKIAGRLPDEVGALLQTAGATRLRELKRAVDAGSGPEVMNVAHSLANLIGVLPIPALAGYTRELYAAANRGDAAAMARAQRRLDEVLRWVLARLEREAVGAAQG